MNAEKSGEKDRKGGFSMKKGKILIVGLIALLMACGLILAGCGDNDDYNNGDDETPGVNDVPLEGTITISPSGSVNTGTQLTAVYSGSEPVSYQWKKNGDNVRSSNNWNNVFTPTEAGSYTVTVSAQGYKSKISSAVTVILVSELEGTITISPSGSVNTGTQLTAVYSGSEPVSYQWKKNGVNVGTSNNWNNVYTPTEEGSYTVTVSGVGYSPKTSVPVTVVAPVPTVSGTYRYSKTDYISGQTATYTITFSGSNCTYHGNITTSEGYTGGTSQTGTYTISGNTVKVTFTNVIMGQNDYILPRPEYQTYTIIDSDSIHDGSVVFRR